MEFLVRFWRERRNELELDDPVRVLVLTYNRTLRGYIESLAEQQIDLGADVSVEVETLGHWAVNLVNKLVIEPRDRSTKLRTLACSAGFRWGERFLLGEIDYVLGRFLPDALDAYLDVERTRRGQAPRVNKASRRRLLDEVVGPYTARETSSGVYDWNDLAVTLATKQVGPEYSVVVVDEAQDYSCSAFPIRATARPADSGARPPVGARARLGTSPRSW